MSEKYFKGLLEEIGEDDRICVYGCYGYSVGLAIKLGLERFKVPKSKFILAGRNRSKIQNFIVEELKCQVDEFEVVVFDVKDAKDALKKVKAKVLLNGAGPFCNTAKYMIDACIASGMHYLDITGEVNVLEYCHSDKVNQEAQKNSVVVMSGTGYDVVPSDCIGLYVIEQFQQKYGETPDSVELAMDFLERNPASHGTMKTIITGLAEDGPSVRVGGKLERADVGGSKKEFQFRKDKRSSEKLESKVCGIIPWGDISTLYRSSDMKVKNIRVYASGMAKNRFQEYFMSSSLFSFSLWMFFKLPFTIGFSQKCIEWFFSRGPNEKHRKEVKLEIIAVASSKEKQILTRLILPEAYLLTAETCLGCAFELLTSRHEGKSGSFTPSKLFGSNYILNFDGTSRSLDRIDRK